MRFLADEGVDGLIVDAVRDDGHDVRWMAEEVDGTKDSFILESAAGFMAGSVRPAGTTLVLVPGHGLPRSDRIVALTECVNRPRRRKKDF